ncbi:putative RNA polymerase II [Trypanosoma rangeli]|uniref:RNA uridylyltransferase n=1 Tax=Trypanosoma rangeli TaxID=5698 RepID=A0A3R7M9K0_TRYRA|nr:putative RNA polymerase II [Trypanosoma rangeli]RNF01885.1 putative RNA polymerase II [Trypanosoma rangeli]|eukprot:RNF01885.1 putative RNA polymerase II [Trypanosoma rangeli]
MALSVRLNSLLLTCKDCARFVDNGRWLQGLLDGFSVESMLGIPSVRAFPCVMLYGSLVAGTAFQDGDADYTILFSSRAPHEELSSLEKLKLSPCNFLEVSREHHQDVLSSILTHIKNKDACTVLEHERIFTARVPIVRLKRKGIEEDSDWFDLSLSLDGLRNSLLLRLYMESDPRLRAGALCAKRWGRLQKILGARRGWISPYALTVMYIFYMQSTGRSCCVINEGQVDKLLEVVAAQSSDDYSLNCSRFYETIPCVDVNVSEVLSDLHGFFRFFGDFREFDFDVDVVDIRTRNKYHSKERWLEAMRGFSEKERWDLLGYELLMLRDPYEPHNLGRSVDFFHAEIVRETFRLASERSTEDLRDLLQME